MKKVKSGLKLKKLLNRYNIKSGKVLDYGAGRGICSVTFAENNYDVYSLDSNDGFEAGLKSLKGVKEKKFEDRNYKFRFSKNSIR